MFVASGPGFGSAGEPRGVRGYVHHAVRTDGLPAPGPPRQIIAPGPRHLAGHARVESRRQSRRHARGGWPNESRKPGRLRLLRGT